MTAKNGIILALIINSVWVSALYGATISATTKSGNTLIPYNAGYNVNGPGAGGNVTVNVKLSPAPPCVDVNLTYSRESSSSGEKESVTITQLNQDYDIKSPSVSDKDNVLSVRIQGSINLADPSVCQPAAYSGSLQVYENGALAMATPQFNIPKVELTPGKACSVTLPDSVSYNTVRPGGDYNNSISLNNLTGDGWVKFTTSDIGTTYPQIHLKNQNGDGSFLPVTTDSPNLYAPGKYWWAGHSGGTSTTSVPLTLTVPLDAKSGDYSATLTATLTCN